MMNTPQIYFLEHPVTKQPFYVGCTTKTLQHRLYGHMSKGARVSSFLNGVGAATIHLLETAHPINAGRIEGYWIQQFRAWGFDLINIELNPPPSLTLYQILYYTDGRFPIKRSITVKSAERKFKTNFYDLREMIERGQIKRCRNIFTEHPLFCQQELTDYFKKHP